jgi:hypothetical protein
VTRARFDEATRKLMDQGAEIWAAGDGWQSEHDVREFVAAMLGEGIKAWARYNCVPRSNDYFVALQTELVELAQEERRLAP